MPLKGKMHVTFDTYTIIATITGPNNIFNQNKLNWVLGGLKNTLLFDVS